MNLNKSFRLKRGEEAVSPVIGVMLMLVVTIIIAAVVSAFAGGLVTTTPKTPNLAMNVVIQNGGSALNSYILFDVQSVSDPIPTSALRITTSWQTMDKNSTSPTYGSVISGGNTTLPAGSTNNTWDGYTSYQSPLGFGAGIASQLNSGNYPPDQNFGNYTLVPGVTMKTSPGFLMSTYNYDGYGLTDSGTSDPYVYHIGQMPTGPGGQPYLDGMQAMLGGNWNNLRPGDIVTVKITHIPSGKVIFSKDVTVTGA